jgi:hypothetical protein
MAKSGKDMLGKVIKFILLGLLKVLLFLFWVLNSVLMALLGKIQDVLHEFLFDEK